MLHDNMNISHLVVYARRFKEARAKRKSRDAKRERSFDGGSQKIGMRYKTSLDLRRGFRIKSLKNSQELVVIGCRTLKSRRKKLLIHQIRSQLVDSVVKSTMVISLRKRIIALVVATVVTR